MTAPKSIDHQWEEIYRLNREIAGEDVSYAFYPPASREKIERIESQLQFRLPESLRKTYSVFNGCRIEHWKGLMFSAVDELEATIKAANNSINVPRQIRYLVPTQTQGGNSGFQSFFGPKRIAFAFDNSYYFVDLLPTLEGSLEQVLRFDPYKDKIEFVAASIADFLQVGIFSLRQKLLDCNRTSAHS